MDTQRVNGGKSLRNCSENFIGGRAFVKFSIHSRYDVSISLTGAHCCILEGCCGSLYVPNQCVKCVRLRPSINVVANHLRGAGTPVESCRVWADTNPTGATCERKYSKDEDNHPWERTAAENRISHVQLPPPQIQCEIRPISQSGHLPVSLLRLERY